MGKHRSTKAAPEWFRSPTGRATLRSGITVNEMIHVVDLYPTFLSLAGGQLGKNKLLEAFTFNVEQ